MFDETNINNNNYYYTLTIEPYLNTHTKQYQNIIVIDNMPNGPLQKFVTRYMPQKLSPFYDVNETIHCKYAIVARQNKDFVTDAELPALLSFLNSNGASNGLSSIFASTPALPSSFASSVHDPNLSTDISLVLLGFQIGFWPDLRE